MSDATGPVSTLPNSVHPVKLGTMCDNHPDRPAYRRVQGETDSFGAEFHDLCTECYENDRMHAAEGRHGGCDRCGEESLGLQPVRDYTEGMAGPVYWYCAACRKLHVAEQHAEFDDEVYGFDD